jgi:hypothetical protein
MANNNNQQAAKHAADAGRDSARKAADEGKKVIDNVTAMSREAKEEAAASAKEAARAGAEIANDVAGTMRETAQSGFALASETAHRSMDQMTKMFGLSGERAEQAARQSSQNLDVMMQCSTVLAQGFQTISREWMNYAQGNVQRNVEGFSAILRSRSPRDVMAAQSELLKQNMEGLLNGGAKIAQLSAEVANEAVQKITASQSQAA